MNEGQIVARLIGAIKDEQSRIAEAGMLTPQRELFTMGEQAGRYQGLQQAQDILQDILSDNLEMEKTS